MYLCFKLYFTYVIIALRNLFISQFHLSYVLNSSCNRNSYVMYSDDEKFGMGGGADGYAFLLTDNLLRGSTSMSDTYLNDLLTVSNLFTCANLEVWMI